MANSKSSQKESRKETISYSPFAIRKQNLPSYLILLLAFLGFLDSVYLTLQHYSGQIPPCTVTHGCEKVLTSQFATVGTIPIAVFGVGYFVTIMVLTILYLQKQQRGILKALFTLATLAFLTGLALIYIQAGILHAFCQFCLGAEILITLIFLLTGWVYIKQKKLRTKD